MSDSATWTNNFNTLGRHQNREKNESLWEPWVISYKLCLEELERFLRGSERSKFEPKTVTWEQITCYNTHTHAHACTRAGTYLHMCRHIHAHACMHTHTYLHCNSYINYLEFVQNSQVKGIASHRTALTLHISRKFGDFPSPTLLTNWLYIQGFPHHS